MSRLFRRLHDFTRYVDISMLPMLPAAYADATICCHATMVYYALRRIPRPRLSKNRTPVQRRQLPQHNGIAEIHVVRAAA